MVKKKKLKKTKKVKAKKVKKVKKLKKTKRAAKKKPAKKKKAAKGKKKKVKAAAKPTKKSKPAKKTITAQKKKAIADASAAVMQRLIGKVVHYYDRIGVAIVDLKEPLKVGDMIMLKKGGTIVPQRVDSIQIEHTPVAIAKRGDVVGIKVDTEAHEGTLVLPG